MYQKLERGQGVLEYSLIFLLVLVVVVVGLVVLGILISSIKSPLEVYETTYAECIARETIDVDRCHDLAVQVADPSNR